MSAIQGSGLEGCLQFRGLDLRGVCNLGFELEGCLQLRVWIRGVSAIQGSGLEGCLQFRGLDLRGVCNLGSELEWCRLLFRDWIRGVFAIQGLRGSSKSVHQILVVNCNSLVLLPVFARVAGA